MVEAGRDVLRSSSPAPLLKQGQIELVAQDSGKILSISKDGESTVSMPRNGQPIPVFDHSHHKMDFSVCSD